MSHRGKQPSVPAKKAPVPASPKPIAAARAPSLQTDPGSAFRQRAALPDTEHPDPIQLRALERAVGNRALGHRLARRPIQPQLPLQKKQNKTGLQHLPHETIQAEAGANNEGVPLEREADELGPEALQRTDGNQSAIGLALEKQGLVNPGPGTIQRYVTKAEGLSVAGELHTKSEEHRQVEIAFASHIKGVDPPTLSYWQEPQTPGSGVLGPLTSSENPDHFLAWDIDRMQHHYRLIRRVLVALPESDGPVALDKVQAAQVALSAQSMLETLTFLGGDLTGRGQAFAEVTDAYNSMAGEYNDIFRRLLEGAKQGSLDAELRTAFATASFPQNLVTIDNEISTLLPGLTGTRGVSYDFTRTVAMNDLANEQKAVQGVWVIGEYHVQEIQEHLGGQVGYDLVSMNDFNADVKAFDASRGGSTIQVDHLGELLTLSRKLSANLEYFVSERDKQGGKEARLAHWGRCMEVLLALEDLVRAGLTQAQFSEALLPGGVKLLDLLRLVLTIHQGLDKERQATEAFDPNDPMAVLPDDIYQLMRDEAVLKAAKDLNVLTGLAEFPLPSS